MIVQCPECNSKSKVEDSRIGPNGVRVRCAKCRQVFSVMRGAAPPPSDNPVTGELFTGDFSIASRSGMAPAAPDEGAGAKTSMVDPATMAKLRDSLLSAPSEPGSSSAGPGRDDAWTSAPTRLFAGGLPPDIAAPDVAAGLESGPTDDTRAGAAPKDLLEAVSAPRHVRFNRLMGVLGAVTLLGLAALYAVTPRLYAKLRQDHPVRLPALPQVVFDSVRSTFYPLGSARRALVVTGAARFVEAVPGRLDAVLSLHDTQDRVVAKSAAVPLGDAIPLSDLLRFGESEGLQAYLYALEQRQAPPALTAGLELPFVVALLDPPALTGLVQSLSLSTGQPPAAAPPPLPPPAVAVPRADDEAPHDRKHAKGLRVGKRRPHRVLGE